MGLEDFEKELAETKSRESKEHRSHRHRDDEDRERSHRRHHRSHRSHRHRDDSRDDERRHRHKRHRDRRDDDDERRHKKRHRSDSPKREKEPKPEKELKVFDSDGEDEDEWVEKEADTTPPQENILDQRSEDLKSTKIQRDSWMEEPCALDIDYVQRKRPKSPPSQFVGAKDSHEFKVHEKDVSRHLADLQRDFDSDGEGENVEVKDEPTQHEVSYTFGDSGSSWRMTKLNAVYRQAKDSGRSVDDVALERYGDLRAFDDAREEERELDRRKMYGKDYVGIEKPSGEFFQERKMKAGIRREPSPVEQMGAPPQGEQMPEAGAPMETAPLDQSALNKLKAQAMKARLRNAPNAAQLEEEYEAAASLANRSQPDVIVLNQAENRMLAGDRSGEVTAVSGKRGRERGLVNENEDMSIEDMVKQEKRTRGVNGGEGRAFAERIAKDGKFANDLDYMDDNAEKLSKKVIKSDTNLRNAAVGDFQKMQRILESCPLCYHEESNQPPTAPVVSLATRTYMTLPTEPEVAKGGAMIVPIQHRLNLLECDDDEWEEMRNFMKSLTRFYHAQDKSVIFYENAAFMNSRKGHAALNAIPLPHHLAENAPAYFKEAILASDEQWSQHKPLIDTLALVQKPGYGKAAFRRAMVKEMPYFHVFFTLDGGMGHVIEDERRWPKGDLFAREIIGGMLDKGPEVIKKQGRWEKHDRRLAGFRKKWDKFDWTKVLMDARSSTTESLGADTLDTPGPDPSYQGHQKSQKSIYTTGTFLLQLNIFDSSGLSHLSHRRTVTHPKLATRYFRMFDSVIPSVDDLAIWAWATTVLSFRGTSHTDFVPGPAISFAGGAALALLWIRRDTDDAPKYTNERRALNDAWRERNETWRRERSDASLERSRNFREDLEKSKEEDKANESRLGRATTRELKSWRDAMTRDIVELGRQLAKDEKLMHETDRLVNELRTDGEKTYQQHLKLIKGRPENSDPAV